MLPKVAGHILHQTSRAAATAQNYALRNVLGLQAPSTSAGGLGGWNAAGSSSWGGYSAGAGGAKYNSGSRFYQGYSVSSLRGALSSSCSAVSPFSRRPPAAP